MNNRRNAYTEVYTILQDLDEEEYKKIPPEVIKAIKENRNLEYYFELDNDLELKEQTLLPQTKVILFNLYRDYLATTEQKEKIIKMQNEERAKIELKKKKMYNSELFPNKESKIEEERQENAKDEIKEKEENSLDLVEYKPSFLNKVWGYIKRLLKRFKL